MSREQLLAFQGRAIARRVPLSGSIAMTHRCNLSCVHCYLGEERAATSRSRELGTPFWLDAVEQIAAAGCFDLLITGGEPLLRDDFAQVYTRAKQLGLLVTVFTNGTRLGARHVRLFSDLPPRLVEISLYGATRDVYEKVTGVPGSYRQCLDGVEALERAGIRVGLKTMILKGNQHEVAAMREMAESRGASFRVDPAVVPCLDGKAGPLEQRVAPAEAIAIEMGDPKVLRKAADHYQRVRDLPSADRLFSCGAGVINFHVAPTGILHPCLMVTGLGFDLQRGTFRTGWDEVMSRLRNMPLPSSYECQACDHRALCGLCPALSGLETGSPYGKSAYACALGEERHRAIEREMDSQTAAREAAPE